MNYTKPSKQIEVYLLVRLRILMKVTLIKNQFNDNYRTPCDGRTFVSDLLLLDIEIQTLISYEYTINLGTLIFSNEYLFTGCSCLGTFSCGVKLILI